MNTKRYFRAPPPKKKQTTAKTNYIHIRGPKSLRLVKRRWYRSHLRSSHGYHVCIIVDLPGLKLTQVEYNFHINYKNIH